MVLYLRYMKRVQTCFKLNSIVMCLGCDERLENLGMNLKFNHYVGDAGVCRYEQDDEYRHHCLGMRTIAEQLQTASMVF